MTELTLMKPERFRQVEKYFLCFLLYSLIGWCYEVFLEVVVYGWGFSNRGVLFGPYCPVYGFGALALIFSVYRLIDGKPASVRLRRLPAVFLGSMLIATAIELAASYLCEALLGYWPWQTYVDYTINFQGRIALSPSVRFGLGGLLFLYILQPLFQRLLSKLNGKSLHWVSGFCGGVFLADFLWFILNSLK